MFGIPSMIYEPLKQGRVLQRKICPRTYSHPDKLPVYFGYIQRKMAHWDADVGPYYLESNVFGSILCHHLKSESSTKHDISKTHIMINTPSVHK
jgi:hypothetical protein